MDKRGAYFFVIDAIIAGVVLVAGLMYIFSTYTVTPEEDPTIRTAEEFMKYISSTRIRDYYSPVVNNMTLNGDITDLDNTLIDQSVEFYYLGEQSLLANLTQNVVDNIIVPERNVMLFINGTLVHNRTVTPLDESDLLISSKRLSFKMINETVIFGPVWIEVRVWV